jgi:D-psicose/D-tagatose/L-ribulose 3-epimerase
LLISKVRGEAGMKIGFCMLLWTTHVGPQHRAILEDLRATGYDGVEIPIFEGAPDHYARLGNMLDDIGLERTAITVIPSLDKNPLGDADQRKGAVSWLKHCLDCAAGLGATQLAGPVHQPLGHFSGKGPTDAERKRAAGVHRKVGDYAGKRDIKLVVEALNRFECYFANTIDQLADYLDMVDHPAVTGMYDTFHANIEEADPVAAYERNVRHISYVHISENDRGVPGRGHVPWKETFRAIKKSGFDSWMTVEAFGRALPDLAAATRVWRDLSESPEAVYRDGFKLIKAGMKRA